MPTDLNSSFCTPFTKPTTHKSIKITKDKLEECNYNEKLHMEDKLGNDYFKQKMAERERETEVYKNYTFEDFDTTNNEFKFLHKLDITDDILELENDTDLMESFVDLIELENKETTPVDLVNEIDTN
jgi:hypothetical protein